MGPGRRGKGNRAPLRLSRDLDGVSGFRPDAAGLRQDFDERLTAFELVNARLADASDDRDGLAAVLHDADGDDRRRTYFCRRVAISFSSRSTEEPPAVTRPRMRQADEAVRVDPERRPR